MSDTPRTDAALQKAWDFDCEWVNPDLCRQLERELSASAELQAKYQAALTQIAETDVMYGSLISAIRTAKDALK